LAQTNHIKLPLDAVAPLFVKKLQTYVELFDLMDQHGGWLPYSDSLLNYFDELGVTHWVDLYSREGQQKWMKDRESQHAELTHAITDAIGNDINFDRVNEFLTELAIDAAQAASENPSDFMTELKFLDLDPSEDLTPSYVQNLSSDERQYQHDVWVNQLVLFYNDLSVAAHGESIFNLVARAIDAQDNDALVKAVQIDRTLLPYFEKHLRRQSLKGNHGFLDSLAYRVNNPPRKGENKHPLLWIFFKDLLAVGCLHQSVTSSQILTHYQMAIGEHPKFSIVDEQIVQRQRRKFNKLYRQAK